MLLAGVCLFVLTTGVASVAGQNVTVHRQLIDYDEEYTLSVNYENEYILELIPSDEEAASGAPAPHVVWAAADPASVRAAQPVLIAAQQRNGAVTWQLPYTSGSRELHELERTLCPLDVPPRELADEEEADCGGGHATLRLHVSAWCVRAAAVRVRVRRAAPWALRADAAVTHTLTQARPLVYTYQFGADDAERAVRLRVTSDDDVCSTVAIQQNVCPIAQSMEEIDSSILQSTRMSVQRSGLVQLARSSYSSGRGVLYVVVAVRDSDAVCTGDERSAGALRDARGEGGAELWSVAVLQLRDREQPPASSAREKTVTITIERALSLRQYALACGVTLGACALLYALFGAVLLLRGLPALAPLLREKAVLADAAQSLEQNTDRTEVDGVTDVESPAAPQRRRRGSDATFDDSDMSDSDEEDTAAPRGGPGANAAHADVTGGTDVADVGAARDAPNTPDVAGTADANGELQSQDTEGPQRNINNTQGSSGAGAGRRPVQLRLAALARRRARVLAARSDRYLHALLTVAVFYALPVMQFVAAFHIFMNVSGSLDTCYYNFLCAHPLGGVSDFNHIFSNCGYLLLGALFVLQVAVRRRRRARSPRHEEYGIPAHYGLSTSLGVCMMVVATFSGIYHVCPNSLNFQFDTAFMYVLAVLSMLKIYQARHPDVNARAHATFAVLAVLIALAVWGVLGGGALFWAVFSVLHIFTFLSISLHIYYLGQFRIGDYAKKVVLQTAARGLVSFQFRPLYTTRLVMLLIANAVNWIFAIYGLISQPENFASHLLEVLLANTLMYMVIYLGMKLAHGERLRWYAWGWAGGAALCWLPALYYFTVSPTRWDFAPAQSRHHNQDCLLLHFYDAHDLWHLLSALALYLTFNLMLTWDDGLAAVKRTEIAVF